MEGGERVEWGQTARGGNGSRVCSPQSPPEGSVVAPMEGVPLALGRLLRLLVKAQGRRSMEEEAVFFSFKEEGRLRRMGMPRALHSS